MKDYDKILKWHLASYLRDELGVTEAGDWRGRFYNHILPRERRELNFLAHCRPGLLAHLQSHRTIKLHQFFHHLSSSQAFAFNLFFPFLERGLPDAEPFFRHFGTIPPDRWEFEAIPDEVERTNVDVTWTSREGATL